YIDGEVIVKENEKRFRVKLETNLIEGTPVEARLKRAFGIADVLGGKGVGGTEGEVDSDGKVTIDIKVADDFFEKYRGYFAELVIRVYPVTYEHINADVYEAYGSNGENFEGSFVYQYDLEGESKRRLESVVTMEIGDETTKYDIEKPERLPLPDDYGDTDIWMEAEVVDNNHRILYVEGKTNLLEGVLLLGDYY